MKLTLGAFTLTPRGPSYMQDADLMILGVSRSGKTPLCIYLGQRGYKVRVPSSPLLPLLEASARQ